MSDLKNNQNRTIQAIHQNNLQVIDLIKLALAEIGGVTLNARLSNQPILNEILKNDINIGKALVLLESGLYWRDIHQHRSIYALEKIALEEEILLNAIKSKLILDDLVMVY